MPSLDWYTVESEHFKLHYHTGEEDLAQPVLRIAEQVHDRLSVYFQWEPGQKTEIVLTDEFDIANGYATAFPTTRMTIYVTAPDDLNTLEDYHSWLETVIVHEYVHVLHLDMARGLPGNLQNVFGRFPFLFPNSLQPRWLMEGIATYMETDVGRGIGRGQSSFFDMYMRMEVAGGFKPLSQINQPMASWPMGTAHYLYGVHFFQFLQDNYGEESVQEFIGNYSDNLIPFRILSNSRETFGQDLEAMWADYTTAMNARYEAQIQAIQAAGQRQGRRITTEGYFNNSLRVLPDGRAYFISFNGQTHTRLMAISSDKTTKALRDVAFGSRLDVHPQAGLLIVQPQRCENAAIYYDIYRARLDGSQLERLSHCGRYRYAIWSPRGDQIIAAKNAVGTTELHLLSEQGELQQVLWRGTNGEQLGGLDWSAKNDQLVASVWYEGHGWDLALFDINTHRWRRLTQDQTIQSHPRFDPAGDAVYFSADYGGAYNIRRLELDSGKVTTLTNVLGGAFHPAYTRGGLYYVGYQQNGFDIYWLPQEQLIDGAKTLPALNVLRRVSDHQHGYPSPYTQTELALTPVERYSPWYGLYPRWWFPYLQIEDERSELGAITSGWDALQRHTYFLTAAYDGKNDWAVGSLDYFYDRWWPVVRLRAERSTDFIRDGDTTTHIRSDDEFVAELILPLMTIEHTWALRLAAVHEQQEDLRTAAGETALPTRRDDLLGLALTYDSTHVYPRSVSRSEGREVRLIYEDSDVLGNSDFRGEVYVGDWREFLRLGGEHVLALRAVEGRGEDTTRKFRLGGVQTNIPGLVFNPVFNRREYTLRGYEEGLSPLIGSNARLLSAEYRFPLVRPERGWMAPPVGLHQLSGALFVDHGGTWQQGGGPDEYYTGVGLELNAQVDLGYLLRPEIVVGYAEGLDDIGESQVYVRLGAAF